MPPDTKKVKAEDRLDLRLGEPEIDLRAVKTGDILTVYFMVTAPPARDVRASEGTPVRRR